MADKFDDVNDLEDILSEIPDGVIPFDPLQAMYNIKFFIEENIERYTDKSITSLEKYSAAENFAYKFLSRDMYLTQNGTLIEGSYSKVGTLEIRLDLCKNVDSLSDFNKVFMSDRKSSPFKADIVYDNTLTHLGLIDGRLYVESVKSEYDDSLNDDLPPII